MVMVRVDIGLMPAPLPTIIHVVLVDSWCFYSFSWEKFTYVSKQPPSLVLPWWNIYWTPKFPLRRYPKGGVSRKYLKNHQGCDVCPNKICPYYSYPSIPPHTHPNMPPHPYPIMPPHIFCAYSIFQFNYYLCTLWSCTPSLYTILGLFTLSTTRYY